ncbi:MAG TPA: PDZ domain-containing protein [Gemmatimonadales bacterium]|nr:PDZ domain-containing protein [Gemmatimonadales bacterium]
MTRRLLALLLALMLPAAARAQSADTIRYEIAFPNAVHHEAEVKVEFRNVPSGTLELRMSRSSPGRYALHEFAKNVYSVKAVDSRGRALTITRPNPHQWDVTGHDGTVVMTYTLFGDRADGTYAAIDGTHAHLNIPATFMWARGFEARPIRITFRPARPDWKVATQLAPTSDPFTFTAPHFQYFMDSPTELSAHDVRSWTVGQGSAARTLRFALHHAGAAAELDTFADRVQKVVAEQAAMWGELPRFDFGTYTFIADYLPYVNGDGMEHRNSTILTSGRPLSAPGFGNLGTVSHEFFHAWNVERIRPKSLEPFDFEEANMSGELWLAEGFTSYYDDLFIRRAGIMSLDQYAEALSGGADFVINAPGRRFFSPVEMSLQAPFVDAAASIDPNNRANTFISYYTWGSVIGLALDLDIRARFAGRSLDDFMRLLWTRHGKTERPYTLADVEAALAEVTSRSYASEVFRRYIFGRDVPPLDTLLARAGLALRPVRPGKVWLGPVGLREQDSTLAVTSSPTIGSPLYEAGVERGDRIVSIAGRAMLTSADLDAVLSDKAPGTTVPAVIIGREGRRDVTVPLSEDFTLEIVTFEKAGRPVSKEIVAFRSAWMGSKAGMRK